MSKNLPNSESPLVSLHAPWNHNKNAIWIASTVRLCRNIEKFKFPQKLEAERKSQVLQLTSKTFLQAPGLLNPYILKADSISPAEKEFLIEHFLLFEGFQEAGAGAAFGLDETGETITLFNIKEHLQIQATDCSGDIEKSWAKVVAIENKLASEVNFAFSPKFGYLTADPLHAGTGLLVSAFLHVPALIHQHTLREHLEKEKAEGIVTTGLQGSPDDLVGDILMLRNIHTLGLNEETIISCVRNSILRIVVAEKEARSKIKASQDLFFKDHICRAIGLLKYSYRLDAQESLNALSFLKLGIELGWVKGMSIEEINTLFFDSRRSHLIYLLHNEDSKADIAPQRAEYLREKAAKLQFKL